MIGILIVTHGSFGGELIRSAEIIMGEQKDHDYLCLRHNDSVTLLQEEIRRKAQSLDKGKGVLVLTDIFGGSPSNSVAIALRDKGYYCLTGVNLPMLLEAFSLRDSLTIEMLAKQCQSSGVEGIKDLFAELM